MSVHTDYLQRLCDGVLIDGLPPLRALGPLRELLHAFRPEGQARA